jgi:hypothetical protein
MMDPRVLAANVTVAVEALDRMIGLEDSDPIRIQYEVAHDTLKAWLAGECPDCGGSPAGYHTRSCRRADNAIS